MATARKTTKEVTTTETVYTLELREEEAMLLGDFLRQMGNAPAQPIADALSNAHTETTPLAVGDRVRVTEPIGNYNGRVGTLVRIDQADGILPYLVAFDDGDDLWIKGVERA